MSRLAELWEAAGNPTLQRVAIATETRMKAARTPVQSHRSLMQRISDWRTGRNVPSRFESLEPVLVTLIGLARQTSAPVPSDLTNRSAWRRLWKTAIAQPVRPTVVTSLRRDIPTLIGREAEVQRILDAAQPNRVVSIHTVDGMPGVGKTALVIRAAHLLSDRFPDGRFFVELNSHTPGQVPADPADVLFTLLTGLGIAPGHIPDSRDARRDLWRDRLATKRVLLVLDDARDHHQIEPLLPAGPECLTLITSRRRLVALDSALPLPLDTLDPGSAIDLFYRLAQRNPHKDDRAAVAAIVRSCGYLPLAIVLLAGRLAHRPAWTLTGLAEEFTAAQDRLAELDTGQRAVRAAFTASYEGLPPERQRLFRRLGLHPGPDFDAYAVAALNGISLPEARSELDALYTDHLVEETIFGRYCLHDLVREYAGTLAAAAPDDGTEPVRRLLDYYCHTAAAADRSLIPKGRPGDETHTAHVTDALVQEFDDETQALAWMRAERANLFACVEYTADHDPARMVRLTAVLSALMERDGPWSSTLRLHQRAAEAADRLGDRLGRADALYNLSIVYWAAGKFEQSADMFRQSLVLFRETGYTLGEADTLAKLGGLHRYSGEYAQSADLLRQANARYREIGHTLGEADTLVRLGSIHRDIGDYGQAVDLFRRALILFRETGYRLGTAGTLGLLGTVQCATGDYKQAAGSLLRAVSLFREIGHRMGEATTLNHLATLHREIADHGQAASLAKQALTLQQEVGFRLGEAEALANLGAICREVGDYDQAADLSRQALGMFREIGYRLKETEALTNTAKVLSMSGNSDAALPMFTAALTLALDIGSRIEQARAVEGIARCHAALDDTATAMTHLRNAIDIYRSIGAAETDAATTYLATLEAMPMESAKSAPTQRL
ncbi:ATP-binding protein [Nocardia sp. NPDC049149]|uniref:ATP-binding protein n=1 Tax=Nocardia sp. NPDC049149 TaxID=3364315 RepID=UPI0037121509